MDREAKMQKLGQDWVQPLRDAMTATTVRSGLLAFLAVVASSACFAASPLPDGYVNSPYNWNNVTCVFGEGCTLTFVKGQLPPGVSLNTDSVLQGTPTQAGLYSFTLKLTINPRGGFPPGSKDTDYTLEIKPQGAPRGHVTVNRSTLHLARSSSNTPTRAQPIFVNIAGPGVIGWTISSSSSTVLASSDVGPTTLISLTSVAGTVGSGIAYIMANPHVVPSTSPSTAIVTI